MFPLSGTKQTQRKSLRRSGNEWFGVDIKSVKRGGLGRFGGEANAPRRRLWHATNDGGETTFV